MMVNGKHAKALDFMVNMMFSGSYFGCAAETKQCCWLAQFLGEDIMQSDARNFFTSISYDLWNGIVKDDEDEEMMKEKIINFLKPQKLYSTFK